MSNPNSLSRLYLRDTQFAKLMTRRIYNVLLIANPYDAFMLEDDGRIEEKIFNEYTSLNLRYPPRFTQVTTYEEAMEQLSSLEYDLIICMPGSGDNESFDVARSIKRQVAGIPMVILTPFSHGITKRMANEDLSAFDYIFCWLGNTDLLVSIIKLLEDKMNMEHDIKEVGVQVILLVEDGIRYYSSILPSLYKFVLQQSRAFATEALNAHQKTLRLRGRPKIALARNLEEARSLYERYKDNILGVITDVRYPLTKDGQKDPLAGVKLCEHIRHEDPFVPLIMQSSEQENIIYAKKFRAAFVDKASKRMDADLRHIMSERFGFGDFIFRNPLTRERIARVRNLKDLQNIIFALPTESLLYHISRNHISRWLYSRAIFPIAEFLKPILWENLKDVDEHRKIIFEAIVEYRKMKNQGVVAVFLKDRFDSYSNFARIGEGSLGGKGRGLAFIDNFLKRHEEFQEMDNATVAIPKTVVLCTDLFDEFMETNKLFEVALQDLDDEVILKYFLNAKLPERLTDDFLTFIEAVKAPIAVRSSSLLEDSHYQPFAGIYSTYMVPYMDDKKLMIRMLSQAIKGVYASVYFRDSKAYMQATSNVIDQEKMAVILQQVVGRSYNDRFYPTFSGVGRSLNYYPIGDEKAEEGTVSLAMGLGKWIVDGGTTLRVCPYHPTKVLQTSEMEIALRETQNHFLALDMSNTGEGMSINDGFNLIKVSVRDAEKDGSLTHIASTFDPYDQVIRDGVWPDGRKLITFKNLLEYDTFPLSRILRLSLKYGAQEMRRPVEIEFACNLPMGKPTEQDPGHFYLLQIRPIVETRQMLEEDLNDIGDDKVLIRSRNALGHGILTDLQDIVYVKTENFSASHNQEIAWELEKVNARFLDAQKGYILSGPGRWGSSDPWLGIPVKWPNISAARVIIEAGLKNYHVDPSQGTHFFQNLTSFGVGYLTVNSHTGDGILRQDILDSLAAQEETRYLRHIHFEHPLTVKMDGRKKHAVVMLPTDIQENRHE